MRFSYATVSWLVTVSAASALINTDYVRAADLGAIPQTVRYSRHVRPILDAHCVECHHGWFPDGGLRLDSLDGIRKGGNSGPAIVPGFPDKGWLMHTLTRAKPRRLQMPPEGKPLSPQQVELIAHWIRQGAK